ncbi:hypothetical protein B0H63DRAFT_560108 [Podospora didyma]|uniref:Transmembrane protein n=1 Tax=Podospora didyma TaxID=330526 RepID=A0AAE0NPZ9_9PEZI|nr:hypothetical protein B0H63DRAFT_560108 [Podospora didyma]
MSSRCSYDCFDSPAELGPYADISGPGVLAGFLGTAWFVVALVVLNYFLGFDPTKNPFQDPAQAEQTVEADGESWSPNHIDQLAIKWSGNAGERLFGELKKREGYKLITERPRWDKAFTKVAKHRYQTARSTLRDGWTSTNLFLCTSKVMLNMCDVQILTGIGILVSAYHDLFCFISAYHWQMVVYLAWFSNLTHIACLIALRAHLHQNQFERGLRLLFMTVLWLGLIVAMVPTAFFNWAKLIGDSRDSGLSIGFFGRTHEPTAAYPSSNTRCFFNKNIGSALFDGALCYRLFTAAGEHDYCADFPLSETSALQSCVVSVVLLFFSYFTRSVKLIKVLSDGVRLNLRKKTSRLFIKMLTTTMKKAQDGDTSMKSRRMARLRDALIAMYLVGKLYADLITSGLSDVYWLIISAVWGNIRLLNARSTAFVNENDWAFGQILPLFLLIGPIIATIEAIVPERVPIRHPNGSTTNESRHVIDGQSTLPQTSHHENTLGTSRLSATIPSRGRTSSEHNDPTNQSQGQDISTITIHSPRNGTTTPPFIALEMEQVVEDDPESTSAILQEYYTKSTWMPVAILLTSVLVIPATVSVFVDISTRNLTTVQLVLFYITNILICQPAYCFLYVLTSIVNHRHQEQPAAMEPLFPNFFSWVELCLSVTWWFFPACLLLSDTLVLVYLTPGLDVLVPFSMIFVYCFLGLPPYYPSSRGTRSPAEPT